MTDEQPKKKLSEEELEKLRQRHEVDQNVPFMCEFYSIMWYRLYTELKDKGFKDEQALELVKAFIQKPS